MMTRIASAVCAVAIACSAAARAETTTTAPARHLVYAFTYESRQHGAVPNDVGTQSNAASYNGTLDDKGTITVDVMKEGSDRGLVVSVSEQGTNTRSAVSTTCAVYGDTRVICDPTKHVNSEEYTLLRFLGVNFINPAQVDNNGQWTISQNTPPVVVSSSYMIKTNDDGVMKIEESRHVKDTSGGYTSLDTQTKIDYNWKRLLPTAIDEYSNEERHAGVNGVSTTVYQTTLTLQSDSMAKP